MADGARTIVMLGIAGVGGYVIYEYTRYSHALSLMDAADTTKQTSTTVQNNLGFMGFLMGNFSTPTTQPALGAYQYVQQVLTTGSAGVQVQSPGTGAASGQPPTTSVTTTTASTGTPSTTAAPAPAQPAAADLQKVLNMTVANADQWNYAYRQLTGYGIEQLYGVGFDVIYGSVDANGNRQTGNITADAFLSLPGNKGLTKKSSISGLGAIARFYTPVVNPMSSMVYRAQHPSPYRFPIGGGMGAFTQATGMEKVLWAGRSLRSSRFL